MPGLTLLVFACVAIALHRQLSEFRFSMVLNHLKSIPRNTVFASMFWTAVSYWLLGFYDVLALRYQGKKVPYARALFTSFIAYAFGHNFGIASLTGGAVRYRLYSTAGLNAADVATVAGFCMVTSAIGLAALAAISFIYVPHTASHLLHLNQNIVLGVGVLLLVGIGIYALWSLAGPRRIELFDYALRAPRPSVALPQIVLAVVDLGVSAVV